MKRSTVGSLLIASIPASVALIDLILGIRQYIASGAGVFYGNDTYAHLLTAVNARRSGGLPTLSDPSLIQWLAAHASALVRTDLVTTYSYMAVFSLPLAILALSFLARRVFGAREAAATALIFGFAAIQPVQTYQDGTIPNIFGIGVIFPLFLVAAHAGLTARERSKQVGFAILALFLLVTLAFTHHLSTLIAVVSICLGSVLYAVRLAITKRGWSKAWALVPLAIPVTALAAAISAGSGSAAVVLLAPTLTLSHSYPWITTHPVEGIRIAWDAARFAAEVGAVPHEYGIAGAVLLTLALRRMKDGAAIIPAVVVAWFIVYWFGSNSTIVYEPGRLARDLALPGSLLAAYGLCAIITYAQSHKIPALSLAVLAPLLISGGFSGAHRLDMMTTHIAVAYSSEDDTVRMKAASNGGPIALYSSTLYWWATSTARNTETSWLPSRADALTFLNQSGARCLVQTNYLHAFSGQGLDQRFAAPLTAPADYTVRRFDNVDRTLWLYCRETPAAKASQNT
jgi:hypothetical protein